MKKGRPVTFVIVVALWENSTLRRVIQLLGYLLAGILSLLACRFYWRMPEQAPDLVQSLQEPTVLAL